MPGTHKIDYEVVFNEIERLKSDLTNEVNTLEQGYSDKLASINNLDSATHTMLLEAMARNRQKAVVTAEVLTKLLEFVRNAALFYDAVDAATSNLYLPEHSGPDPRNLRIR